MVTEASPKGLTLCLFNKSLSESFLLNSSTNGNGKLVANVTLYLLTILLQFFLGALLWSRIDRNWLRASALSIPVIAILFHSVLVLSTVVYHLTGYTASLWSTLLTTYSFIILFLAWSFLKTKSSPLKISLRFLSVFIFLLISGLIFLRPFTNIFTTIEMFDFYNHWGYILRRFIVDDILSNSKNITDWSMFDYPFLGSSWVYLQAKFIDSDFVGRYRSFWMLCLSLLFALGNLKRDKKSAFAFLFSLLVLRYWEKNSPTIAMSYTGLMDFPVGIINLWLTYTLYLYLKLSSRRDFYVTLILSITVAQLRIEGIVIFAAALSILGLNSLYKKSLIRDLPFYLLSCLVPTLWIFYVKTELNNLGHGGSVNWTNLQTYVVPFTQQILLAQLWMAASIVLIFILSVGVAMKAKREFWSYLSLILPTLGLISFYIVAYSGIWLELLEMDRRFGKLMPTFLFVGILGTLLVQKRALILPKRKTLATGLAVLGVFAGGSDLQQFEKVKTQLNTYSSYYHEFPCLQKLHAPLPSERLWVAIKDFEPKQDDADSYLMLKLYLYPHYVARVGNLSNDQEIRADFEKHYLHMEKSRILNGPLVTVDLKDCNVSVR